MRDDLKVFEDARSGFALTLELDKTIPDEQPAILMTIYDQDDYMSGQIVFEFEDAKSVAYAIESMIAVAKAKSR